MTLPALMLSQPGVWLVLNRILHAGVCTCGTAKLKEFPHRELSGASSHKKEAWSPQPAHSTQSWGYLGHQLPNFGRQEALLVPCELRVTTGHTAPPGTPELQRFWEVLGRPNPLREVRFCSGGFAVWEQLLCLKIWPQTFITRC